MALWYINTYTSCTRLILCICMYVLNKNSHTWGIYLITGQMFMNLMLTGYILWPIMCIYHINTLKNMHYVFVHASIIHTYIRTYICTYTYLCAHTFIYMPIHTYTHTYICTIMPYRSPVQLLNVIKWIKLLQPIIISHSLLQYNHKCHPDSTDLRDPLICIIALYVHRIFQTAKVS